MIVTSVNNNNDNGADGGCEDGLSGAKWLGLMVGNRGLWSGQGFAHGLRMQCALREDTWGCDLGLALVCDVRGFGDNGWSGTRFRV